MWMLLDNANTKLEKLSPHAHSRKVLQQVPKWGQQTHCCNSSRGSGAGSTVRQALRGKQVRDPNGQQDECVFRSNDQEH
eukprot:m.262778 g.262778  ORF g.262778 m.262778 type:complete len:79 (-) comp15596_c1_seq1:120-356(-)